MAAETTADVPLARDPLVVGLVRALAGAAASASERRGFAFDMDDPSAARAVIEVTLQAMTGADPRFDGRPAS